MVAPAQPTPSTSRSSSSSWSTSKRPSDGKQSYHRRQAKLRLTEINGKLAKTEDRLGRLTRKLNARRDLERKAQAAREEIARLKGIRKEYGEHRFQDSFRGPSGPKHPGTQQQPKLHGARRLSPIRASRRNFHEVHSDPPCRSSHRPCGETRASQKKGGIDWTSIHETNEWGRTFESDLDGERQDRYLFTSANSPSLLGRSTSPGPPPYGKAKTARDAIQKHHEDSTDSHSCSNAQSTDI